MCRSLWRWMVVVESKFVGAINFEGRGNFEGSIPFLGGKILRIQRDDGFEWQLNTISLVLDENLTY